jgi:hypothetical protein
LNPILSHAKKATSAFSQLSPIWESKQISLNTRIRLFNANVKSVLLSGCETCEETREIRKKLQSYVNRCLRSILGIWWPNVISDEDLWERTEQTELWKETIYRKLKWILRQGNESIANKALE